MKKLFWRIALIPGIAVPSLCLVIVMIGLVAPAWMITGKVYFDQSLTITIKVLNFFFSKAGLEIQQEDPLDRL